MSTPRSAALGVFEMINSAKAPAAIPPRRKAGVVKAPATAAVTHLAAFALDSSGIGVAAVSSTTTMYWRSSYGFASKGMGLAIDGSFVEFHTCAGAARRGARSRDVLEVRVAHDIGSTPNPFVGSATQRVVGGVSGSNPPARRQRLQTAVRGRIASGSWPT